MKTRFIYMMPTFLLNDEMFNPFYFSNLNDNADTLPRELLELLKICKENDCVFTVDNFALCFNLQDKECEMGEYIMFYPDEKFNDQITKFLN